MTNERIIDFFERFTDAKEVMKQVMEDCSIQEELLKALLREWQTKALKVIPKMSKE